MTLGAGSFQNLQIDSSRWYPKIGSFFYLTSGYKVEKPVSPDASVTRYLFLTKINKASPGGGGGTAVGWTTEDTESGIRFCWTIFFFNLGAERVVWDYDMHTLANNMSGYELEFKEPEWEWVNSWGKHNGMSNLQFKGLPQKMDPFTIGNKDVCARTVADNLSKILRIKESRNSYGIW